MRHFVGLLIGLTVVLLSAGCGVKVFISDTRLRGTVPPPEVLAVRAATQTAQAAAATPTPSSQEAASIKDIIRDLERRVGEDLTAVASFSGRETPIAGPLRGMRVEPGDLVRISSGRSQDTALEASDYCVEVEGSQRCSRVWVHGRPAGGSLGAWYPIVIFDYQPGG